MYTCSIDPTKPNVTPKQTPKADPRSALCPLWVCFLKICVSSKSAMVYSGSALGVRFTHCSVVQTHHFSYHLDLRVYFWNRGLLSMSTLDQPGGVLLGVSSGVTTADPKQTLSIIRHRKQTQSLVEVCFNSVRLGLIGRVKMRFHLRTTQCIGCIYIPGIG